MTQICIIWFVFLSFAWPSLAARCVSKWGFEKHAVRFMMSAHCVRTAVSDSTHLQHHWDKQSCANFKLHTMSLSSVQYNNRSLSPWRYRIDENQDRIPLKIMVAECLCKGCIINNHEDMTYNSVPVLSTFNVLHKTECPGNPQRYRVTVNSITIPVACTCVVPRYTVKYNG